MESDYSTVSPQKVSAYDFVQSQSSMPWYSFFSIKQVFIEQGAFFLINATLLYTSIIFLVSIMNDLAQQNSIMYIEGSNSMENEKKRLYFIMTLFGCSYIARAGCDLMIAIYIVDFQELSVDYPGFFELLQSLYFILTDLIPIGCLFNLHNQVYGEREEG